MIIKQLSVFVENVPGRLEKVTEVLRDNKINIDSFSLADTSDYGVLRMIVSNPLLGQKVLKEEGFSAMLTDVLNINILQAPGALHEVLKLLYNENVSVEYMYTLNTKGENTSIILKVSDIERANGLFENK